MDGLHRSPNILPQPIHVPAIKSRPAFPPCPDLSLNLPRYKYRLSRTPVVPLDRVKTNNCHFESLEEAMFYIFQHSLHHFGSCTKAMAFAYIIECSIYNPSVDDYVSYQDVSAQDVTRVFNAMCGGAGK
jgi:hypothetical protein